MSTITTVIPVYKNKEMTLKNLRHNYPFLKNTKVILVDDYSQEDFRVDIERDFPDIVFLENSSNRGFGPTVNAGIRDSKGKYILLLNSDVILDDTSYLKGVKYLEEHDDYFAVSFMQHERDGSLVGKNKLYFDRGFISHKKVTDNSIGVNGWAEGGSAIFRSSFLRKLGGFSDLYAPFYYEDIDLSYRAYKRGWKVLFSPDIVVQHFHESTIGTYIRKDYVKKIAQRNHFIFMWHCLSDVRLFTEHIIFLSMSLVRQALGGNGIFIQAFFMAIMKLPQIYKSRRTQEYTISDRTILNIYEK